MRTKAKDYSDTWEGGFVRLDANGRKVFVIRRMIDGVSYKVSTRASTERAALEQLQRFEADPVNYRPGGAAEKQPVFINRDLVEEFLHWSRDERKNTREWLEKQKRFLAWWADKIGDVDLKKVSVNDHIKPALKDATSTQHRIAVLKAFYGWLRKQKHQISLAQDPTFAYSTHADHRFRGEADRAFHAKPITRARVTGLVLATSSASACWSNSPWSF